MKTVRRFCSWAFAVSVATSAVAVGQPPVPGGAVGQFQGFKPPAAGAFVTQAIVNWINVRTGERFVAPTGGWTPPSVDWVVEDPSQSAIPKPAQDRAPTR